MAIITEKLQLNKQFLIIDSPVPFTLLANNGTDSVYRMAGCWQLDTHKLLPEKYMKQYPVFNLDLVYDDTNLNGGSVVVRESNIDIGDGISGVNGQDVRITNQTLTVVNDKDVNNQNIPLDVNITNNFFLAKVFYKSTSDINDLLNFYDNNYIFEGDNNNRLLLSKEIVYFSITYNDGSAQRVVVIGDKLFKKENGAFVLKGEIYYIVLRKDISQFDYTYIANGSFTTLSITVSQITNITYRFYY